MFASPTFTGTPLSTTATSGTNTTQIATTEFVQTAVSNLVDTAPAALNTLNELATALGNDASFATSVSTAIGLKAPIANPTFTGTVGGITSTMVGLGNVTNESKATMFASPTFTGTVSGVTATHVGLGNVTNESKATMFASPTFTGTVSGVTATHVGLGNVENTALSTSTHYIGTTSITYNRASASQTLNGVSIDGNAGTVTNGVYTTDTGSITNTMLAGSIANSKLTNSSITFGSTAQALGSTISGITGVTLNNGVIGGTTPAAGTFTTLTATDQIYQNNLSMLGISLIMS